MDSKVMLLAQDCLTQKDISPAAIRDHFSIPESLIVARLAETRLGLGPAGLTALPAGLSMGLMGSVLGQVQTCLHDGSPETETLQMLLELILAEGASAGLAARLIERFGSLGGVVSAPAEMLSIVAGMAAPVVALLKLVHHTIFRITHAEVKSRPVLNNWDKLIDYLTVTMAYEPVEQFRTLFLDSRNTLIADEIMARGTINGVAVYPREILKRGLALEASAIILVHNHPSGCSEPSRDDIIMTKNIQAALTPIEIVLHDHVIIGKGNWFSFRQNNLLGKG